MRLKRWASSKAGPFAYSDTAGCGKIGKQELNQRKSGTNKAQRILFIFCPRIRKTPADVNQAVID
jgi:hypothetical protein